MAGALDFTEKATILVVDDIPDNLTLMRGLLKDEFKVKVASSGERALIIVQSETPPDLILLDIMMPEMDGYEVCGRLRANSATSNIPIIFLTAKSSIEDQEKGFALGAVDYITKPINPHIMLARVRAQLALKATTDFLRDKAGYLEQEVGRRTRQMQAVQDAAIQAMASMAEARGGDSGNHIRRTQLYVEALARKLKEYPRFTSALTGDAIRMIVKSAPLHDIGNIGLPDRILLKPSRFEPEERKLMETHTTLGYDALSRAEQRLDVPVEFLATAKEIVHSHHEKWDGSGYPQGLAGNAIPLSARLMALADVYDALIRRKVYSRSITHEQAVEIIAESRGKHFDPDITDAFLAIAGTFREIASRHADSDDDLQKEIERLEFISEAIELK